MADHLMTKIYSIDSRRNIVIPGDTDTTILFAVNQFLDLAKKAIASKGTFFVALSGGQTPHAIFQELAKNHQHSLAWEKVWCFWSDERSVSPTNNESNYFNALTAGLALLPLKKEHIFRMKAEESIEINALAYEELIKKNVPSGIFDLIMLGMGEDGHTASLFPETAGLHVENRWVIANYIPQKTTWRMSMTFECINHARHISIYVMGSGKKKMVQKVFNSDYNPNLFPIQKVGTSSNQALWILDESAAALLKDEFLNN